MRSNEYLYRYWFSERIEPSNLKSDFQKALNKVESMVKGSRQYFQRLFKKEREILLNDPNAKRVYANKVRRFIKKVNASYGISHPSQAERIAYEIGLADKNRYNFDCERPNIAAGVRG